MQEFKDGIKHMAYGEFANIYDELIYEDIDYKKVSNKIIELCNMNNIKFDDYLDLACGTGNVAINVAKYFKSTYHKLKASTHTFSYISLYVL